MRINKVPNVEVNKEIYHLIENSTSYVSLLAKEIPGKRYTEFKPAIKKEEIPILTLLPWTNKVPDELNFTFMYIHVKKNILILSLFFFIFHK